MSRCLEPAAVAGRGIRITRAEEAEEAAARTSFENMLRLIFPRP